MRTLLYGSLRAVICTWSWNMLVLLAKDTWQPDISITKRSLRASRTCEGTCGAVDVARSELRLVGGTQHTLLCAANQSDHASGSVLAPACTLTGPAQRPAATPVHQKNIRSASYGRAGGTNRHFMMMRDGPDARPAPHFALNKPHFTPGVSSKRLGAG